mmetsp:Transcript_42889/g.124018  ORF Transcript_42889/g.124018 Transcript_42889/m.124018 type:complete len:99 (-) Transcript_42889:1857-2153(-)
MPTRSATPQLKQLAMSDDGGKQGSKTTLLSLVEVPAWGSPRLRWGPPCLPASKLRLMRLGGDCRDKQKAAVKSCLTAAGEREDADTSWNSCQFKTNLY